jgi:hypothetical protein
MRSSRKNRVIKRKRSARKGKHKTSRKHCGGNGSPSTFYFYNRFHYGDNILNLKFFYVNAKLLKEKNIRIHYYYDNNYIKNKTELERYVDPGVVELHQLSEKPVSAIELWMGNNIGSTNYTDFANYYNLFYKQILTYLGLQDLPIDTSLFQKEDYLLDLYNKLDPKFKDIDILIINSEPQSLQFQFDKVKMDELCIKLAKTFKVVTTNEVNSSIPSTLTNGLTMQDIGAISTHAKYIIAVFTGPITSCLNFHTVNHVKKWFIIQNGVFKMNLPSCVEINNVNEFNKIVIDAV